MLRITFIEPPITVYKPGSYFKSDSPLLWMLTLMTYLKNEMVESVLFNVLDGQILGMKQILRKLKKLKPDIVGLSPKHHTYSNAVIIARAAKKLGSRVVMGGPHASSLAREILLNRGPVSEDYCVDAVVKGDGEKAFYEYVTNKNLSAIKNLVFVRKDKNVIVENPLEYLDVRRLPRINRKLINPEQYFKLHVKKGFKSRLFPAYTHRGCFYGQVDGHGCIFCGADKILRLREPLNFWEEVKELVKNYGATRILNFADGFPLDMNLPWFREFYKVSLNYKKKPALALCTLPRFINKRTIRIMKEMNVKSLRLPFADMFPGCAIGTLSHLKKKDLEKLCTPFKLLNDAGILAATYLRPGIFRETPEDIMKIFELSRFLSSMKNIKVIFARGYLPLPGSKGWQMLLEKTGNKYKGKDLIDQREIGHDWVKNFSDANLLPELARLERSIPKNRNFLPFL